MPKEIKCMTFDELLNEFQCEVIRSYHLRFSKGGDVRANELKNAIRERFAWMTNDRDNARKQMRDRLDLSW